MCGCRCLIQMVSRRQRRFESFIVVVILMSLQNDDENSELLKVSTVTMSSFQGRSYVWSAFDPSCARLTYDIVHRRGHSNRSSSDTSGRTKRSARSCPWAVRIVTS